jgi:hypothetical protein
MSRIYSREGKRGTVWYSDFFQDGRRIRKRLGRSKRLAELALADIQVKLERKELGFAAKDRKLARVGDGLSVAVGRMKGFWKLIETGGVYPG